MELIWLEKVQGNRGLSLGVNFVYYFGPNVSLALLHVSVVI